MKHRACCRRLQLLSKALPLVDLVLCCSAYKSNDSKCTPAFKSGVVSYTAFYSISWKWLGVILIHFLPLYLFPGLFIIRCSSTPHLTPCAEEALLLAHQPSGPHLVKQQKNAIDINDDFFTIQTAVLMTCVKSLASA